MYDQAMQLSYNTPWYTMNEPSAVLAERLAAHAPGDLNHVFYTTGGSTAVETALRFMQFYNNARGRPEKKHMTLPSSRRHQRARRGATMCLPSVMVASRGSSALAPL